MSHRFSIRLIDAARRAGVDGAHLRWPRRGRPVLVGHYHGHRITLALPRDKGRTLPDGVALRRLRCLLADATDRVAVAATRH